MRIKPGIFIPDQIQVLLPHAQGPPLIDIFSISKSLLSLVAFIDEHVLWLEMALNDEWCKHMKKTNVEVLVLILWYRWKILRGASSTAGCDWMRPTWGFRSISRRSENRGSIFPKSQKDRFLWRKRLSLMRTISMSKFWISIALIMTSRLKILSLSTIFPSREQSLSCCILSKATSRSGWTLPRASKA